jgi:hypothetical protein
MTKVTHLGRFRTSDAGRPTRDVLAEMNDGRVTGRTIDVAEKMELARFPGHHVVAEREGEDLVVYQIGDPDGLGVNVTGGATGDRAPKTTADLQRVYDAVFSGRRKTFEQQAQRHDASQVLADRVRRRD